MLKCSQGCQLSCTSGMTWRKGKYNLLRKSSGKIHLFILEDKVEEMRERGRPRLTLANDVEEWAEVNTCAKLKKMAEEKRWKSIVVNLQARR